MSPSPWHPFRNRLAGARPSRRRRLTLTLLVALLVAGTATGTPATASPRTTDQAPGQTAAGDAVAGETTGRQTAGSDAAAGVAQATPESCEALAELDLADTRQISAQLVTNGSAAGQSNLPEFCRVALTVAPQINVEVWLPTDTYNGRFQAVGGGGYAGVISFGAMAGALRNGYATASTDTGHSAFETPGGSFALNPDGTLNWQLIEDFASRSLIELTKKSQQLIDAFYGQDPAYSYWNGCSTGGRQGLMLAQRFPEGYDGILAGAPAINWDRFIPAELWPQVVMQQELGGPIEPCKLVEATEAAVAHCDTLDGVADGIIADPRRCDFEAETLVGQVTACGEITTADARAIEKIWEGARATDESFLWYGLAPGAPLGALAGAIPFPIAEQHHRFWIEQDPTWDWHTLDLAGFEENFRESQRLFNAVIGTDDPDLSAFRDAGGKTIIWHGWNDQLIFPEGTIDYYDAVRATFHSTRQVQRFARLFVAPGVAHCGGGPGPNQFDMFGALVRWVEEGDAPDSITASRIEDGTVVRTQPLCPYPSVARYDGQGDPNSADSFACKPNFGQWGTPGQG
jgi:pimeloyl-ACP methyl ester carboxylesterase